MKRISICGVDGSGKTTLLKAIERHQAGAREPVALLRALRYSASGAELSVNRLSDSFGDMGTLADEAGLPAVKACALFLAMTLYGAAESELVRQRRCRVLFRERDPIADSLAYAGVYVKLLRERFSDAIVERYGDPSYDGHLRELVAREGLGFEALPFAEVPMYVRAVFSTPFPKVVTVLERLYGTGSADAIVFLRLTPEMMKRRMALKFAESGGRTPEFHEEHETLVKLQAGLEQAILAFRELRRFEVVTVDVDDRPAEEIARDLFRRFVE